MNSEYLKGWSEGAQLVTQLARLYGRRAKGMVTRLGEEKEIECLLVFDSTLKSHLEGERDAFLSASGRQATKRFVVFPSDAWGGACQAEHP